MNFYNDIYSWTFIKDCNLETRIPFTTYRDKNILLGNYEVPLDNPNNVELKTAIINVWMFKKGSIDVSGSVTSNSDDTNDFNTENGRFGMRGHIESKGRFDINQSWRWGFDGNWTPDDT